STGGVSLRVAPALVETDLVVTVTAAETVVAGGPGALVRCSSTEAMRASGATSLLETAGSNGWRLALAIQRLLGGPGPPFRIPLPPHPPPPSPPPPPPPATLP